MDGVAAGERLHASRRRLPPHPILRVGGRGFYWSGVRVRQVSWSAMAAPVGSKWTTPSSVEQKLRLPPPVLGNPVAKYWSAGTLPLPVELKVYPLFVPEASRVSMRQALVWSGGAQLMPPRAASVGAKPTFG